MTDEQKAREFAENAIVLHWQRRVKAEKENRALYGQITTVKDCYEYGFLAGMEAGRASLKRELLAVGYHQLRKKLEE